MSFKIVQPETFAMQYFLGPLFLPSTHTYTHPPFAFFHISLSSTRNFVSFVNFSHYLSLFAAIWLHFIHITVQIDDDGGGQIIHFMQFSFLNTRNFVSYSLCRCEILTIFLLLHYKNVKIYFKM